MSDATSVSTPRVAYVMSRFPRLSETFVLFEMIALESAGASVELFPLIRERATVIHPEARPFVDRMHYEVAASPRVVMSNLWWLRTDPRRYLRTLASVVRGTRRSMNFLFGGLAAFPKIAHYAREMQELNVDHVHCHFANHPALAGFVIHRLTGMPYSFTAHGSDLHVDRTMLGDKVSEAAFVVTISEYNRRLIVESCGSEVPTDHLHVIHCGVDTDVFAPRPARDADDGALRLLSIGTLHEVKGQQYLLRACAELQRRGVDVRCVLVGDGADRSMLESLSEELGLGDALTMVGRRTREQIAEHVADADVLVAPSVPTGGGKREGIPVVLMEAMSAGLPVVSSRISGIPELVDDGVNGLLAEPFEWSQLADALERLARDPDLRRRLGVAARDTVLAEFDVASNARALLQLIVSVQTAREDAGSESC
jgi:glycosyltransferase involved in cell wall biosynthesis